MLEPGNFQENSGKVPGKLACATEVLDGANLSAPPYRQFCGRNWLVQLSKADSSALTCWGAVAPVRSLGLPRGVPGGPRAAAFTGSVAGGPGSARFPQPAT